jgi:CRP-like cAMP-binding protein
MQGKSVHSRLVFYPGDLVFSEGDEAGWAYLVQSGKIEIFTMKPDGSEYTLALLGPGRLFGEMALIDELPRMASARAIEMTTLVLISNEILSKSLENAPPLVLELIHNISNNLRSLTRKHLVTAGTENDGHRPYLGNVLS